MSDLVQRWKEIYDVYLTIIRETTSSEGRREQPTICLADACQRIAELEDSHGQRHREMATMLSALMLSLGMDEVRVTPASLLRAPDYSITTYRDFATDEIVIRIREEKKEARGDERL